MFVMLIVLFKLIIFVFVVVKCFKKLVFLEL